MSRKSGRPPVSSVISTKLLKLNANDEISSGVSGLRISGSVIWVKLVIGPAPATADASYRSAGIDLMSPMQTIIMYGKPSQVLTIRIIVLARNGSENHAGLTPNSAFSTRFTSPMLWLNMPLKIRIEMKPGTA